MGQCRQTIFAKTLAYYCTTEPKIGHILTAETKLRTVKTTGNILLDQKATAEWFALLASGCGEVRYPSGIDSLPLIG